MEEGGGRGYVDQQGRTWAFKIFEKITSILLVVKNIGRIAAEVL